MKSNIIAIFIMICIFIITFLLFSGCTARKASKLDCETETIFKRTCESTGKGVTVIPLPGNGDNLK